MGDSFALIYSSVPALKCQRKCADSCGPIMADDAEMAHFEKKTGGKFPDSLQMLKDGNLDCPYLSFDNSCRVYQHRPLICRLWGVVKAMRCPHGCIPARWLSDSEARELLRRASEAKQ
jgi:hypothetical protein